MKKCSPGNVGSLEAFNGQLPTFSNSDGSVDFIQPLRINNNNRNDYIAPTISYRFAPL